MGVILYHLFLVCTQKSRVESTFQGSREKSRVDGKVTVISSACVGLEGVNVGLNVDL